MDIDGEIECPQCGRSFTVLIREISAGATKSCPNGHRIKLTETGGAGKTAQQSLDDLDRAFKRFGK
ncbi:hypothetical protein [Pseudactinotalea terrae]|uniref:hypothetical protein n=1 Tax=Pseudactinotalea terrae TaxID=1743262 RepID=UPI0012E1CA0A|nr:hypothetical protein [Pseudactinotalea terrae]